MRKTIVMAVLGCLMVGWTVNGTDQTVTLDRAALEKMIRDEVARQVPEAVSKELARLNADNLKASALSTIFTIRSQIVLYSLQHEDKYPLMEAMTNWSALTQATDSRGRFRDKGAEGTIYGPYVMREVSNPITGRSKVAPAGKANAESGWVYNELTGDFRIVLPEQQAKAMGFLDRDIEVLK